MKDSLNIVCPWCGATESNDCIDYHSDFRTRCTVCRKAFDVVTRINSKNDKWETFKYTENDQ